jgi:hypothetical protein
MSVADDLRLAWHADRDGRTGRRDALLTLALAASPPGADWAERLRCRLVADRPEHPFARFSSLAKALADPRVSRALGRLRASYPPAKVCHLLLRAEAARGLHSGRTTSLPRQLDDLFAAVTPTRNSRQRPLGTAATPSNTAPSRPRSAANPLHVPPASDSLTAFYLTILLAVASLLAFVLQSQESGARAA